MLPVTFCRKSSIENLSYCEQQWYITYILGHSPTPNAKAEWGTIAHKVLEILALCKLALQKGENKIEDKEIGLEFTFTKEDLYKPTILSPLQIDEINSSRINKDIYKNKCQLKYGHMRYGTELVEYLIPKVYQYYKKHSPNKWPPISAKHVNNWVWMTLDYCNGLYDPRKLNIVAPEQFFEIEIKEPWAQYSYDYKGNKLEGYLKLKGTIDITIDRGGLYEILDYKTGSRKDWATGEVKTYKKLQNEPQLLLYFYVAQQIYQVDTIVSIFYIRDGGPYTLCYTKEKIEEALDLFKRSFDRMRNMTIPKLLDPTQEDFRCKRLCDYAKSKDGQNLCHFIHDQIVQLGIDKVTELHSQSHHHVDKYQAPGSVC